jgi:hypothetical protein
MRETDINDNDTGRLGFSDLQHHHAHGLFLEHHLVAPESRREPPRTVIPGDAFP